MGTKPVRKLALHATAVVLLASACSGGDGGLDGHVRAVRFANEKAGWAVGDDGLVMHTPDAGKTWTRQSSGVTSALRALAVARTPGGNFVGVAAGDGGALVRTNDGSVWSRVDVAISETLRSAEVNANGTLFLVAGDAGTLLRSEDAGDSWTSVVVGSANVTEIKLDASGDVATAIDDAGAVWESRDRARHFERVHGPDGTLAQNLEF